MPAACRYFLMGVFMLVFTGLDKALLDRAARMFDAKAASLRWEEIQDPKKRRAAKEEFDRHKRMPSTCAPSGCG